MTTLDDNPWESFSTSREKNDILTDGHNKNSIRGRGKNLKVNEPYVFNFGVFNFLIKEFGL